MSLVATYVQATDGKFYKGAVIFEEGWFVCFDDDDPPELVVFEGHKIPNLDWFERKNTPHSGGHRCVPPDWKKMRKAKSYWGTLIKRIPIPTEYDGVVDSKNQIFEGVIYEKELK